MVVIKQKVAISRPRKKNLGRNVRCNF